MVDFTAGCEPGIRIPFGHYKTVLSCINLTLIPYSEVSVRLYSCREAFSSRSRVTVSASICKQTAAMSLNVRGVLGSVTLCSLVVLLLAAAAFTPATATRSYGRGGYHRDSPPPSPRKYGHKSPPPHHKSHPPHHEYKSHPPHHEYKSPPPHVKQSPPPVYKSSPPPVYKSSPPPPVVKSSPPPPVVKSSPPPPVYKSSPPPPVYKSSPPPYVTKSPPPPASY